MKKEKELSYKKTNTWEKYDKDDVFSLAQDYINFLNNSKTERESISAAKELAIKKGFIEIKDEDLDLKKVRGDKFFFINREKNIALVYLGKEKLQKGFNLIASHIDAPRIDLKQNPMYESQNITLLQTHYYGGIKKYQWVSIPLTLHGVIYTKNGEKLFLKIGEKEGEPVFAISDLLPHLAAGQYEKKISDAITGESLDAICGHIPLADDSKKEKSEKIKEHILEFLFKNYGITEQNFMSAELELVPAFNARDLGFDKGMILGYGHDDRVCGFTSLKAVLDLKKSPEKTSIAFLADKEEIGSEGDTGMQSEFLEYIIEKLQLITDEKVSLRSIFRNSSALSGDVNAAVDPNYLDVFEIQNSAIIGNGIAITKFTGSRGKSGAHDSSAEMLQKVLTLFNEHGVVWQSAELGKVDVGGGGTVAKFLSKRGIQVLDCGPALLSMHAPQEILSKGDLYSTYLAYKTFLEHYK